MTLSTSNQPVKGDIVHHRADQDPAWHGWALNCIDLNGLAALGANPRR